jgi:hypothetical protein
MNDTHPKMASFQLELVRNATHQRRTELMNAFSRDLINASRATLLKKHNGNELEAKLEWVRINYGVTIEQRIRKHIANND